MAVPGNPAPLPPPPPRLISRSKWGPKGRKKIFETGPPSLYVRVWIPPPPPLPLYRGLDPPMPVTKFLDVNERIYMILSFVPGEGLKVIESGFSGAACEQQTYFRSSLLSSPDNQKCVCCSQAVSGMAFFVSNTYFHCTKNWIYTNLLGANMVQKSVFPLANTMTWNILKPFNSLMLNNRKYLFLL